MSTHTIAPQPAPARNEEDHRLFVVCSRMPLGIRNAEGVFAEFLGGQFLFQLLRLTLTTSGVELVKPAEEVATANLFRALCIFPVRDPIAAARAVQPVLHANHLHPFFFCGHFDMKFKSWQALGASRPDFDFDQYLTGLFDSCREDNNRRTALIQEFLATHRPTTPPPLPPTA